MEPRSYYNIANRTRMGSRLSIEWTEGGGVIFTHFSEGLLSTGQVQDFCESQLMVMTAIHRLNLLRRVQHWLSFYGDPDMYEAAQWLVDQLFQFVHEPVIIEEPPRPLRSDAN